MNWRVSIRSVKHLSLMRLIFGKNYIYLLNKQCRSHSDLLCRRLSITGFFRVFLLLFCISQLAPKVNLTRLLKGHFLDCWSGLPRFTSPHTQKVTKNNLRQVAKDVAKSLFTTSFSKCVSRNLNIEMDCFHIKLQNSKLLEACWKFERGASP